VLLIYWIGAQQVIGRAHGTPSQIKAVSALQGVRQRRARHAILFALAVAEWFRAKREKTDK